MSNWRTILLSDLTAAAASGKVGIIQAAATARGLPDPAAAAITMVTQELRATIGFSGKYAVDQVSTSIPSGLLDLAIKKIVREMTRAVQMGLTPDEQADEKTYESRLDKIRMGQWPIDLPDTPIVTGQVTVGPSAQLLSSQRRRFKTGEQRGL